MKKMIFISSGRCGTRRLYEILKYSLAGEDFAVVHQMGLSRLANVAGNIMTRVAPCKRLRRHLYSQIISKYDNKRHFISTDPLTAMIVPDRYIRSGNICCVHLIRDDRGFAESIYRLSRTRKKSFIAHNFIPFWQPGLWPFENLMRHNILEKYARVNQFKNRFFEKRYGANPNYTRVNMREIFQNGRLAELIRSFFGYDIEISPAELSKKSNASL